MQFIIDLTLDLLFNLVDFVSFLIKVPSLFISPYLELPPELSIAFSFLIFMLVTIAIFKIKDMII